MTDRDESSPSGFWRVLRIAALSLAAVFLVVLAGGFAAAHLERHGSLSPLAIAFLATDALLVAACIWLIVRSARAPSGEEPLTRRERLNRNILIACGALGGVMAVVMSLASERSPIEGGGVFSNDPLPAAVALGLILVIGLVVPAVSYVWHRTVDEQEADAYKTGALYAFYVYGLGAPLWWVAWRGGFVPPPDGFIIYFATMTTILIVWFWKKYR